MNRLIVDGYNVVHAWPELKRLLSVSLEAARDELVERLSVYSLVTGTPVTVVFDAHRTAAQNNAEEEKDGVKIIFTRRGHSADNAIERMAYQSAEAGDMITVATSDRFQRDLVRGTGGAVISAAELERQVGEAAAELARRVKRYER